jgi:hypothetical protein|tara:strand:+ start:206 stop:340 length:135 start_codon:yes stop_codon:yes gene_type:complete
MVKKTKRWSGAHRAGILSSTLFSPKKTTRTASAPSRNIYELNEI